MARKPTGKPAGHPVIYQEDAARPVSVSVRIPRAVYEQLELFCWQQRETQSAVILQGLRRGGPPAPEHDPTPPPPATASPVAPPAPPPPLTPIPLRRVVRRG